SERCCARAPRAGLQTNRSTRDRSQSAGVDWRAGNCRGARSRLLEKGRVMGLNTDSIVSVPPPNQDPSPEKKRKSGVIIPHAPRWNQRLGAWIVVTLVRTVAATIRYRYDDRSDFFNGAPRGPAL